MQDDYYILIIAKDWKTWQKIRPNLEIPGQNIVIHKSSDNMR